MPPTLDLSGTATQKIMVAPPRFNLRRTVSYTHERDRDRDRGPLSSTSSRFGFEHLIFSSPPPSPGLPQLVPPPSHRGRGRGRGRLPARTPRPSRILRALLAAVGFVLVVYIALRAVREFLGGSSRKTAALTSSSVTRVPGDGLRYHWPDLRRPRGKPWHDPYDGLIGSNRLPDHPAPVLVRDSSKSATRWTVSIPPNHRFPLTAAEYVELCAQCAVVAERATALQGNGRGGGGGGGGSGSFYFGFSWLWSGGRRWLGLGEQPPVAASRSRKAQSSAAARDRSFVDVHEAEVAGFLSGSVSIGTLMQQQATEASQLVGEGSSPSFGDRPVCGSSLTFVLESSDAGLGQTLMLLWIAYAQAQEEGRGFFIDDSRWQYGRYTDLFVPPPVPSCRPPLRHEMLPCPRAARHLVLSLDTAREFFFPGSSPEEDNDDGKEEEEEEVLLTAPQPQTPEAIAAAAAAAAAEAAAEEKAEAQRNAHLFDLARRGYEALFRLTDEDARHVSGRVQQLRVKAAKAAKATGENEDDAHLKSSTTLVGVHVRRGDRRPVEFQYRDSYMPLNLYTDQAYAVMEAQQAAKSKKKHHPSGGLLVLASDDPTVYEADEVAGAARAQEHIRLAGKAGKAGGGDGDASHEDANRGEFHKFVDETFGWEGGFFASMFWNLGRPAVADVPDAKSPPQPQLPSPSPDTLRVRSLVGRAYVLDLAVLAQASDAVVCAVSATGCRLLAVMLGREAALAQGRWINIDGASGWWAVDL